MKIAYLDTISGIAGDMTLGAFVSAGVPLDKLTADLRKLPLEGFDLAGSHVQQAGIDAVHIDVMIPDHPHTHRGLSDISSIIDRSSLPTRVKDRAKSIFAVIAGAEAKIHSTTVEKVHFHEVGAIDAIIDIVGAAICLEHFQIERLYSSPVKVGNGGLIGSAHGRLPIPAPATLEILRGYPIVLTAVPHELTTPTGAAIIRALSSGMLSEEVLTVEGIGYGTGTKHFEEFPNLCRVVIADLESEYEQDQVSIIETNIDDMNPQLYPYILEKLIALGAHDAYLVPIIMKKGRPGILLSVMVNQSRRDPVINFLYAQTSTIGLRIQNVGRKKLPRRQAEFTTSLGRVSAKVVQHDNQETIAPEFEECKRIAEEKGLPLLEVMHTLERELVQLLKNRQ